MQPHLCRTLLVSLTLLGVSALQAQSNKPTGQSQNPNTPTVPVQPMPGGYPYSGPINYVRTWEPNGRYSDANAIVGAPASEVRQATQYMDGLGRPVQTVQRAASPTGGDMVAPITYDAFGREAQKYLPYVSSTGDGSFKTNPFPEQQGFYQSGFKDINGGVMLQGEQVYYSQINYEASPLNRVTKSLAPGNSWAGQDKGVSQQYLANTKAEGVRIWTIALDPLTYTSNDQSTNIPTSPDTYEDGTLYKTVTLDEESHAVVEYKDKEGRVVLKKVQLEAVPSDFSGHDHFLCTYYVYDDLGQLRFVIPPKAVGAIKGDWNLSNHTDVIGELCFRYEYDSRGRMTAKKVPGAGWVYMVYDQRDRLVFSQDANLRGKAQWLTTLYDGLNRPVMTGITTYSGSPVQLQSVVNSQTTVPEVPAGTQSDLVLSAFNTSGSYVALSSITLDAGFESTTGGTFSAEIVGGAASGGTSIVDGIEVVLNPLPQGSTFVALTKTFYDDYRWTQKTYQTQNNGYLSGDVFIGGSAHAEALPSVASTLTKGLVTGSMTRTLEDVSDYSRGAWLSQVSFYDEKARVVQLQADNVEGGTDITTSQYDFTGKVLGSYTAHANPKSTSTPSLTVKTTMVYDAMGRLLQVFKTLNNDDAHKELLVKNSYDALGQLSRKELGHKGGDQNAAPLETLDYTYNIRGWLKGINSDYATHPEKGLDRFFGEDLSYDWGFSTPELNGNISGQIWRSKGDGEQRAYGYSYDAVSRLSKAEFSQNTGGWSNSAMDFTVQGAVDGSGISYDENGNIQSMLQKGIKGTTTGATLDALHYSYYQNSNKLKQVVDDNPADNKLGDFHYEASTKTAIDYGYDANGNLVADQNKKIGSTAATNVTDGTTATGGGIVYNLLNLPNVITTPKGTITYLYDAVGNKLKKTVVENAAAGNGQVQTTTITTYIGPFVYESKVHSPSQVGDYTNRLQFFSHQEGRVRPTLDANNTPAGYTYDYLLKDHLGNVRAVLTEEGKQDQYPAATMEDALAAKEEALYTNLNTTRSDLPNGYPIDHSYSDPNSKVAKVSGGDGHQKIGPAIVLKVMAGDHFNVNVNTWYKLQPSQTPDPSSRPITELITALSGGIASLSAGELGTTELQSNSGVTQGVQDFFTQQTAISAPGRVMAYLNWILLDDQFHFVSASSGAVQVPAESEFGNGGSNPVVKPLTQTGLPITKNGYLYVYVSNETPNIDVFFDNLQVTHVHGPLLEETHYYPFGLTMAGISSKAVEYGKPENKYKFNGIEQNTTFDLNMYDAHYRNMDPQLGRFWQIDPKIEGAESWSPYSAMLDNPIRYSDPLGDSAIKPIVVKPELKPVARDKVCQNCLVNEQNIKNRGIQPSGENSEGKTDNGGIIFTSKYGQGGGPVSSSPDGQPENIDNLLDAFGAVNKAKPWDLKPGTDGWDAVKLFSKGAKQVQSDQHKSSAGNEGRLEPNMEYDVTPSFYPAQTPSNVGRTIIRTDSQGKVKDTIKMPSDDQIKQKKFNNDTVRNKNYNP